MTQQQFLKKALPMLLALIAVLLLAFSCSALKSNKTELKISSGDQVYAEIGSLEITNEEVYIKLLDRFGANHLSTIVDSDLLSEFIVAAKADTDFDINELLEKETYQGLTLEEASKTFSTEELTDMEDNFYDIVIMNGFKSIDDYKETGYLNHAMKLYLIDTLEKEYIESSNEEPLITLGNLRDEYENFYYEEACVVKVMFSNLADANEALLRQGLDVNTDGNLVKAFYVGEEYISPDLVSVYPTSAEELATLEVSDAEILEAYVAIYNEKYGNRDSITYSNGSVLECGSDDLSVNFDDLYSKSPVQANYIFKLLDSESNNTVLENPIPYTEEPTPLAISVTQDGATTNAYFIMYKVSGDNLNVFRDLFNETTEEEYIEFLSQKPSTINAGINTDLLNTLLNDLFEQVTSDSSIVSDYLAQLRTSKELTIYDAYLEKAFVSGYGETVTNDGDEDVVASYLNNEGTLVNITADEFFKSLSDKYGASTAALLLNLEISKSDSNLVDELVDDAKRAEITTSISDYKSQFQQGAYASYGFDPNAMNWESFMYYAFSVRTEVDFYNLFLGDELKVAYEETLFNNEELSNTYYDKMIDFYQDSFSIDLLHFLIYVDNNEDGSPDMHIEENDNWTDYQQDMALELIEKLRTRLLESIEENEATVDTLNLIADEYKTSSYESELGEDDYSECAIYKRAGLLIKVEDLGEVTSVGYEESFTDEAKAMYLEMIEDDLFNLVSNNNASTRYGYHLIYATDYNEKLDAYPDDSTKIYPSKDDIVQYLNNDVEQSSDVIDFLDEYYMSIREEYITNYTSIIYDDLRTSLGEIEFSDPAIQSAYETILITNKAIAERSEN